MKPKKPIVIPYHKLPHEKHGKIKLCNGDVAYFKDGRRLEAYRSTDGPGIFFRIVSPLGKGNESMLKFRLSDEAALALSQLIIRKLPPTQSPPASK